MYDNRESSLLRLYWFFPGRLWKMSSASDTTYMNQQFWFSNDHNSGKTGTGINIMQLLAT